MQVHEHTVAAMGCVAVVIVVDGAADLLVHADRRLHELERRWSRFLPDSEVSRFNAASASGEPTPDVSDDTQLLLARAADGYRITGGRFDPYRLDAVVAAGYRGPLDRSAAATLTAPLPGAPTAGLDPGGIGKGLAADLISAELLGDGAAGALVSIGGDVRVRGVAPGGGPWRIDIDDPRGGGVLTTVQLTDGAVATSSRLKRRWTGADGRERHHLIDPATGGCAASPVIAASVVAGSAWQAEVLTKVAFLDAFGDAALSDDAGFALIEKLGAAALVVTDDLVATTSRWAHFDTTAGA